MADGKDLNGFTSPKVNDASGVECGCEAFGSETGINNIPGGMLNVARDGEAGLTLNMTATPEQRERFINE